MGHGYLAVVTGGGSGIGKEIALKFARLKYSVVVLDINLPSAEQVVREASSYGVPARALMVDVTKEEQVRDAAEKIQDEYSTISVLVNNAGVSDQVEPVLEQDTARWERILSVHLKGTCLCSLVFGRMMVERGYGKIVNIASVAGMVGFPRRTAYGPAKAGIIMLTKILAIEWAQYGINVNAVAPGYIETPLVTSLAQAGKINLSTIINRTPMKCLGTGEDVANAVAFLASDEARFITGSTLVVDGGWTAYGHV